MMSFRNFRNKAQVVALSSGVACFVGGLWLTHFYLGRLADILFWASLIVAVVSAMLSLPRWKSLAALGIVGLSIWWSGGRAWATYYSTNASPDGRYKIVTYSLPQLFAFPGQGSDASGYIQLQDGSGKVLGEGYVEMVQIVNEAEWRAVEVQIGRGDNGYTWKLPE